MSQRQEHIEAAEAAGWLIGETEPDVFEASYGNGTVGFSEWSSETPPPGAVYRWRSDSRPENGALYLNADDGVFDASENQQYQIATLTPAPAEG